MKTTRLLHRIHRWTGLLAGINILILSVTGAYLVFSEEIHHYFELPRGEALAQVDMASATPLQDAFDALTAQHPEWKANSVFVPEDEEHVLGLFLRENVETFHAFELDTQTGQVFAHAESPADKFTDIVLHLHADLLLGTAGILFLGLVGMLFVISTVTGLIIYAPFMKQAAYGMLRWDKGYRRGAADLHKLIGATSLGFNLVIAVTGVALTIGFFFARLWLFQTAAATIAADTEHRQAIEALPPIDVAWASAAAAQPDTPISSVSFPGPLQGPHHFLIFHSEPGSITSHIPKVTLSPASAPEEAMAIPVPLWVAATLISVPFHFGNFGGLALKIVYAFFGLSAGALSVTGALLTFSAWAKRRRMLRRHTSEAPSPELTLSTADERGSH